MRKRSRPGVASAVDSLRSLVGQYTRQGMDALPPIAELAPRLSVSHATAWKAVRVLCDEGLLRARRGSGTYIVKQVIPTVAPVIPRDTERTDTRARWEAVRDQIVVDYLVGGAAQREVLPNGKVLVSRYGASYSTVSKALESLTNDGRLERSGREYGIVYAPGGRSSRCVVLVAPAMSDNTIAFRFPNEEENLRWLEKECSGRGLSLRILTVDADCRHIGLSVPGRTPFSHDDIARLEPLGYLLWLPGSFGRKIEDALRLLPVGTAPMAVAASQQNLLALDDIRTRHRLAGFATSEYGRAAGEVVAHYLLARGHRKILLLAPRNTSDTTGTRVAGMSAVCKSAGADLQMCRYHTRKRPPLGTPRRELGDLTRFMDAAAGLLPKTKYNASVLGAIADAKTTVMNSRRNAEQRAFIREAYRGVPGDFAPTAIVAFNDPCAIACLRILRDDRVRVPEDMSLISFDDTTEASLAEVTSFNFNESKVMLSMLDWVLWPGRSRRRKTMPPPAGFITQRGTVATLR